MVVVVVCSIQNVVRQRFVFGNCVGSSSTFIGIQMGQIIVGPDVMPTDQNPIVRRVF